MPVLTGTNTRLAVPDDEHAFDLLARLTRLQLRGLDAVPARLGGALPSVWSRTIAPLSSTTTSRTVIAWIGTATTSLRASRS